MNLNYVRRFAVSLAVGILTASVAFAQQATDNVVIVLDSSGSMGRPLPGTAMDKMTAAKAALKQVLSSVPQETHIGLLVFSAQGVSDEWIYPLGPRDDARLMNAIDQPRPGYGTPLGVYLKKGADRLLQERAKQFGYGTFRLLVVTDGEAEDQKLVDRYTPELVARGIKVDVIGVAMNQRHTLATKVHSYRSANDPASLKQALAEVFGEIGGRSDDATSAAVFQEIASIPNEVAVGMIQALSSSGNHPIGEKPQVARTVETAAQTPAVQVEHSPPAPQQVGARWGVSFVALAVGAMCFGIVALIILFLIMRIANRSRR